MEAELRRCVWLPLIHYRTHKSYSLNSLFLVSYHAGPALIRNNASIVGRGGRRLGGSCGYLATVPRQAIDPTRL